jgi:hypothetical protein
MGLFSVLLRRALPLWVPTKQLQLQQIQFLIKKIQTSQNEFLVFFYLLAVIVLEKYVNPEVPKRT